MATKKRIVKAVKKEVTPEVDKNVVMFQVSELRKDKILYVLESLSVSMLGLLLFIGAPSVFPEIINPYLPSSLKIMQTIIIIPVVVFVLVFVSNMIRWIKLVKLTKLLKK